MIHKPSVSVMCGEKGELEIFGMMAGWVDAVKVGVAIKPSLFSIHWQRIRGGLIAIRKETRPAHKDDDRTAIIGVASGTGGTAKEPLGKV